MTSSRHLTLQTFSVIIILLGAFLTFWGASNYQQANILKLHSLGVSGSAADAANISFRVALFYLVASIWGVSMLFSGYKIFKAFKYNWKLDFPIKLVFASICIGLVCFGVGISYYNNMLLLSILFISIVYYVSLKLCKN